MGHHDQAVIGGEDAEALQLRADLLLGLHALADGEAEEGLPAREVAGLGGACRPSGVDDDQTLGVLDREGVDRERLRPLPVKERVRQAAAVADPLSPADGDGDRPGLDVWIFISKGGDDGRYRVS
jgi:hypothetical protein